MTRFPSPILLGPDENPRPIFPSSRRHFLSVVKMPMALIDPQQARSWRREVGCEEPFRQPQALAGATGLMAVR